MPKDPEFGTKSNPFGNFFSGWRWLGDGEPDSTQTDAQRIASSRDGWNVGVNSQQRMADLMRAARMPIGRQGARSLQPNDPRLGRIGGAFGAPPVDPNQSGQFTPGYTPAPPPPPPPTIDDLYAQLYDLQRGTAQGTYDAIADWASGKEKTGTRQLADYRGRLGAQFDEQLSLIHI